jgi:hypothetical protein
MMDKKLKDALEKNKMKCLVNLGQSILQCYDSGGIEDEDIFKMLEILFPKLREEDRRHLLCQCYDKQFFSEINIKDRWGFDVWEQKNKIQKEWKIEHEKNKS